MRRVALSEVKDDLSKYLRLAEDERIVITRRGKRAGVLVGFGSEEDWFDYRLETDPGFLERIAKARADLKAGRGVSWRISPISVLGLASVRPDPVVEIGSTSSGSEVRGNP